MSDSVNRTSDGGAIRTDGVDCCARCGLIRLPDGTCPRACAPAARCMFCSGKVDDKGICFDLCLSRRVGRMDDLLDPEVKK